jgi:hypothetical protein
MPLKSKDAETLSRWIRDLHLYAGLFISPFVLVFAVSVFFLVHAWLPGASTSQPGALRTVSELPLPSNLEQLSGRERIDALKPVLARAGVHGEVSWIQHLAREKRLVVPVFVPGRLTTVTIDIPQRQASVKEQSTGLANALVELHKSPGPHLVGMRNNSGWMRAWFWLADTTVYLVMFVTVSGVYLWALLRSQRKAGLVLLVSGALSLVGLCYAILH